jgi:aminopeptidase-like protein
MGSLGNDMLQLAHKLIPIYRTITSPGLKESLEIIRDQELPGLKISSFKTGKKVFDWEIPRVYTVNFAYIETPHGERICEFRVNNLHLVAHSKAVNVEIPLSKLQEHLYSIPDQPDAIPYVTAYYGDTWGFCLTHKQRMNLTDGIYRVVIDAELKTGKMFYGELVIPGKSRKEVLISTYLCHPNMANNEISGPVVATYLAKYLLRKNNHYTYRFIMIPETIGSIAYLSRNLKNLKKRLIAGFVFTCLGDERAFSMVQSKKGGTLSDRTAEYVLARITESPKFYSWSERGSDERQFCAPGIDLPVASIMRSKYHTYPEYHTSLDKIGQVVTAEGLNGGFEFAKQIMDVIEKNLKPLAVIKCEPMLGRHGLYPNVSIKNGYQNAKLFTELLTWSDGEIDLLEISKKTGFEVEDLFRTAIILKDKKLLKTKY